MFKYFSKHIFVAGGYISGWMFLWFLHFDALIIDTASLIFLPAGLRVCAYLFLPKCYWISIFSADLCASFVLDILTGTTHQSLYTILGSNLLPVLSYFVFAYCFCQIYSTLNFQRPQQSVVFIIGVFITSFCYGTIRILLLQKNVDFDLTLFNQILSFAFGDTMGILFMVTFVVVMLDLTKSNGYKESQRYSWLDILVLTAIMTCVLFVPDNSVEINYAKIVVIFTIIGVTYRHGLSGSLVSLCIVVICIVYYVAVIESSVNKLPEQTFFVSLSVLSIILGSVVTLNRQYATDLQEQNDRLKTKTSQLEEALELNRKLNQNIFRIQEQERQRIAKELHDEIGQSMTAMRIEMKLLEPFQPPEGLNILGQLKHIAQNINETTHRMMNALHPRGLSELGLLDAIQYGDVAELLKKAQVKLVVKVQGNSKIIPSHTALVLYRIFQETSSNSMKYAHASKIVVKIDVSESSVVMAVKDNGIGFSNNESKPLSGLGILGIKERIYALNGTHKLWSSEFGTEHQVSIPLD
ncbi:histidine kinase [Opacimonas viscosa]|uniref:histidine kinase n=1 Tax=Opacimonas viscosa TaxID=2961944 RepID=A0AA42BLX7_9ALTE|nr:histidine kinase [Opacimonas viscosa]MCP3429069.1 histidine kinase [Opacimonas viscosa]